MLEQVSDFLANTPLWSVEMISIIIFAGAFVGFVNSVAGLATAISYALFMAMGMPINIANATTRFGVLAQFSVSSVLFKKHGYLDVRLAVKVGIPIALGSFLGAELASRLPANITEIAMGVMLPLMGVLLFIDKNKISQKYNITASSQMTTLKYIIFFFIGIYGGFTHAGVGLLIIFGSFLFLGLDLLHSNAIKQLAVTIYTPIALVVFMIHDQINWPVAIIYAIGNVIGGILGTKIAIKAGDRFIKICVLIVVIVMSIYLISKQF